VFLIQLPLTNNEFFNLYQALPLPIKVRGNDYKFIFTQPEQDYLLIDTAKRHFTKLGLDEIHECNTISKDLKICKHTQPVQLTHLDEVCEAQMI
jgi:thiamine monophosphate kinase